MTYRITSPSTLLRNQEDKGAAIQNAKVSSQRQFLRNAFLSFVNKELERIEKRIILKLRRCSEKENRAEKCEETVTLVKDVQKNPFNPLVQDLTVFV